MLKIFLTGDNHFGQPYSAYGEKAERIRESRMESFRCAVRKAEEDGMDLLVVSGDLFDRERNIRSSLVLQVVQSLALFSGTILVLPGNHDFYREEEPDSVWELFEKEASSLGNVVVLKECRRYDVPLPSGEAVHVYPAPCDAKTSGENRIGWMKEEKMEQGEGHYNVGIAHGTLKGVSADTGEVYFVMGREELEAIPVDVWLIGHTHVPYPSGVPADRFEKEGKIYNAGTHEQTDAANNTAGSCFEILVDEKKGVRAKRIPTGHLFFRRLDVSVQGKEDGKGALKEALEKKTEGWDDRTFVEAGVSGRVSPQEYADREEVYGEVLGRFADYRVHDASLARILTKEEVRKEYPEGSFPARLLEKLLEEGKVGQAMSAEELLRQIRERQEGRK